ncbi:MAG: hypothetical protein RIB69_17060 [Roseovarius sp.]
MDDPPMVAPKLLIHVPGNLLDRHGQAGFGLYGRIAPDLRRMGLEVDFVERPSTTELGTYSKADFHLVHHGFLRRFNLLNCGIAYVWPYWYLDQRGVLCDSSMINATPRLAGVDGRQAEKFFNALHGKTVERGVSKYDQPERRAPMGQGAIVVFLQGLSDPVLRSMHMMETEMLDLVMRYRQGRRVLIKPHPKFPDTIASAHALMLAENEPEVQVIDANIHDLLEGAYCSVSICSGASFEGLFHRVPAILFGRSDFAACAWTVRTEEEAERALKEIGSAEFPYERFLFWFLRKKMYNQRNPNLAARVLQRIKRTGFELMPNGAASPVARVLGQAGDGEPAAPMVPPTNPKIPDKRSRKT